MESPTQIRKHIEVLSDFEQKYGEYLVACHNRQLEERSDWSSRQWAEHERELRRLAPRADAAIDASGVGGLAVYWPPALGGGLKADDLASMIFEVRESGFGVETFDEGLRQGILDRLPSQIEGLKMWLEEAEAEPSKPTLRHSLKLPQIQWPGWGWVNHPWTIALGSGIFLLVLGLILSRVL